MQNCSGTVSEKLSIKPIGTDNPVQVIFHEGSRERRISWVPWLPADEPLKTDGARELPGHIIDVTLR